MLTYDSLQYMIGHIPRRVTYRMGGGVREYYRCLRRSQSVEHRRHGDVRQVDYHAETIHLRHDEL